MNKPLFLIVGKSGSGKTTLVNMLEAERGLKSVVSYTTRKPRYESEPGHIFVSDEEFDALENIVAYTEYNGCRYCATADQLDKCDTYVIDVDGVEYLLDKYTSDREIIILYLIADTYVLIDRMRDRGDTERKILTRVYNDNLFDWLDRLYDLSCKYGSIIIECDANQDITDVFDEVVAMINIYGR